MEQRLEAALWRWRKGHELRDTGASRSWKGRGKYTPLVPLEEKHPRLTSRPLPSRIVKIYICVFTL